MRYSKFNRRITKFLILALTVTTVFFGIPPGTARAVSPQDLTNNLPESTPGGFTITWYDAKRYKPAGTPVDYHDYGQSKLSWTLFSSMNFLSWFNDTSEESPQIDAVKSAQAYDSFDKSVCLGTQSLTADTLNTTSAVLDKYTWGEINGYVKMPVTGGMTCDLSGKEHVDYCILFNDDPGFYGSWGDKSITGLLNIYINGTRDFKKDTIIHFSLRIGFRRIDPSIKDGTFSFNLGTYDPNEQDSLWYPTPIPGECYYSKLSLKDMPPFFIFDPNDYTLSLDETHGAFPVEKYEYGIVAPGSVISSADGFQPLKLGVNSLTSDSGTVYVRDKTTKSIYVPICKASYAPPGNPTVTKRTPSMVSLTWAAPTRGLPVTGYDIYRKEVGYTEAIASFDTRMISAAGNYVKVGSMKELSFTDRGLKQDMIYEYAVAANYDSLSPQTSAPVRSDSVPMTDLPGTPTNLRLVNIIQGQKNDVVIRWDEAPPLDNMAYNIYRKLTKPAASAVESSTPGTFILSGFPDEPPKLIGRSSTTEFTDRGLDYKDACVYYVQASSAKGYVSFISAPLNVTVTVMAPTAPDNLKIGNVQRSGEEVKYDFPDKTDIVNALMGPRREVVLQWDPSKDNSKVVGYNIYRKGFGKDLKTYEYWEESEHLAGNTTENVFIDSGLKLGGDYIYTVEAIDDEDNRTRGKAAEVCTMKSALSDLVIKNGVKNLIPSPTFAYYNTDYKLDVANEIEAIRLIPQKADNLSAVVINGIGVDGGVDIALDPGENIIPIEVQQSSATQETMNYTLTVNRANLEDIPALKLTDPGVAIREGDIYKASGSIALQADRDWKGTVDYGDGTGIQPLRPDKDGSFVLQHQYLDNGKYTVNVVFRYLDKGLVKASLEAAVDNVVPVLTGIKDEYTVKDGGQLKIDGSVVDPGKDKWVVTGSFDDPANRLSTDVMVDRSFSLVSAFYDQRPEYDMVLKVMDDDGGTWSKNVKIKVENVAPSIQLKGVPMVQVGTDFIGSGSIADPGQDSWRGIVNYGDGSWVPMNFGTDKNFDLKHVYKKLGNYTITVQVEDNNGASGSASIPVKVKQAVTSLEAGEDISMNEGDTLKRDVPVWGYLRAVKEIRVDFGDGSAEETVWKNPDIPGSLTRPDASSRRSTIVGTGPSQVLILEGGQSILNIITEQKVQNTPQTAPNAQGDTLSLKHTYKNSGTFTVKAKIIDKEGDVYEDSFNVEVANVAPSVKLSDGTIYAGDNFTCRGTVTDPGDDTWTVEISSNYGFQPEIIDLGNDKSFSFDRIYTKTGLYEITATVRDDNGGVGSGSCQLTVNRHPKASSASGSSDATLHSLSIDNSTYLLKSPSGGSGFNSGWLNYSYDTSDATMLSPAIIVTADGGATIQYSNGTTTWSLPQNTGKTISIGSWTITVTAEDGVTTKTYTITVTP